MTVFVLGSGFSKLSGAPLTREILSNIFSKAENNNSTLANWLRDHLFKGESSWLEDHQSIEEILSRLELYRHYQRENHKTTEVEHIKNQLLYEFLVKLHPNCLPEPPSLYFEFTQSLSINDIIITFNYDLVLEKTLSLSGLPWSYKEQKDFLHLIKPHGSLNFFHCPECGEFFYTELCNLPLELKMICETCKGPITLPYIITPSLYKFYNEIYRKDAKSVFDILKSCEEIIFIGYSLSMADTLVYQLFDLASYSNPNLRKVLIVNGPNYNCRPYANIYSEDILTNTGLYFDKFLGQ